MPVVRVAPEAVVETMATVVIDVHVAPAAPDLVFVTSVVPAVSDVRLTLASAAVPMAAATFAVALEAAPVLPTPTPKMPVAPLVATEAPAVILLSSKAMVRIKKADLNVYLVLLSLLLQHKTKNANPKQN